MGASTTTTRPRLVSARQVVSLLDLDPGAVGSAVKSGRLPIAAEDLDGEALFRTSDVVRFAAQLQRGAAA